MGKRRTYTDEQFKIAVSKEESWRGVLKSLGLREGGGTYVGIQKLAKKLGLDTSHMTHQGWNKAGPAFRKINPAIPLVEILVRDSTYQSTSDLKQRLFKEGLKSKRCEICGLTEWNGKPAPLQLDHVDGDRTNNMIENLRILCPNCHAQTATYCGRNRRLPRVRGTGRQHRLKPD